MRDIVTEKRFRSGNITTKYLFETYPNGFQGTSLSDEECRYLAAVAGCLHVAHQKRARLFLNQQTY